MDSITPDAPVLPFTESTTSPDDSLHHSRTRDPSHRAQPEAIDESMVLKQRNAMLENILLEKGRLLDLVHTMFKCSLLIEFAQELILRRSCKLSHTLELSRLQEP
jgi:hypothetical protein